MIIIFTFNLA